MKKTPDRPRKDLLRFQLALVTALSLLILGWLGWDAYRDYRHAEEQLPAIGRMERVRAEIVHLDEVLTMSARMAVASGNPDWEKRYRQFEPQLDQSIKEAILLDPNAALGASAAKTDAANVALVAMENGAFELVRQGKNAEAQRLLSSGEYEAHKKAYAAGMTEFNGHLLQDSDSMRAELRARLRQNVITTTASVVLLILGALFVFRAVRRWQAVTAESNQQLNQKTVELGELNDQLDSKVNERTKELNESIRGHQLAAERAEVSEARFRSLTEMSSDFYWESDAEHRLTERSSADKKLSTVSVFSHGARIGERRWEIPYLSPDEAGWQAHRAMLDAHLAFRDFELSRLAVDGTERHISISGDPVFDALGAFKGYHGVGTDITARKRSEQALRESAQKLRVLADNIPAITVSWDEDLRCRFANKLFKEFFGLSGKDITGKHMREIVGQEVYREVEGHFMRALQGHPVTYQVTRRLQHGESHYLEIKLLPHIGEHGKVLGCFSVTTDITEHKLAEERIQRVAHHDSLTGLPNRLLFDDRLSQAIGLAKRNSRQFALLYLDLDKFKPVNDTLGHTAGDELLQGVATRIRRQVRESDTVARVGGDEFIVILVDIASRAEAQAVAMKITAALAAPFQLGNQKQSVGIGISIGIAVYPQDARGADALVKAADAAMYRAKQAGSRPLPWAA